MRPLALFAASLALAACASPPTVTRTDAQLTPQQIADMGLVCREIRPPDSNIGRTICATPEAWAADDQRERERSETLQRENANQLTNNRFSGLRNP